MNIILFESALLDGNLRHFPRIVNYARVIRVREQRQLVSVLFQDPDRPRAGRIAGRMPAL